MGKVSNENASTGERTRSFRINDFIRASGVVTPAAG